MLKFLAIATIVLLAIQPHSNAETPAQQIAQLQAQLTALQKQVTALATANASLTATVNTLANSPVLALAPFESVDPNPQNGVRGPNITFKGANIHIVSGSGSSGDYNSVGGTTGLGNLIIGYDELPPTALDLNRDRLGNHNLVMGAGHRFGRYANGGIVQGYNNQIGNGPSVVLASFNSYAATTGAVIGGAIT